MKRLIVAVSAGSLSIAALTTGSEKASSLPEQKTVEVLRARLRCYELGSPSAPTVLILHGLGARGRNHLASAASLAQSFHILLPDQIGHGHSDKPRLTYRVLRFRRGLPAGPRPPPRACDRFVTGRLDRRGPRDPIPAARRQARLVDSAGVNLLGRKFSRDDIPKELYVASLSDQRKLLERVFLDKSTISDARVEATFRDQVQDGDAGTIESNARRHRR